MEKNKNATVTTLCSPKGGVGRTSMVVALAATLARQGNRTLAIDLDPTGHTTTWLLGDEGDRGKALMATLQEAETPLTWETTAHGVDVVAGGSRSRGALTVMDTTLGRIRFKRALEQARQLYDHILIDTPPICVERCLPALAVSHTIFAPIWPCVYSVDAVSTVHRRVEELRAEGVRLTAGLIAPVISDHHAFRLSMQHSDPGLLFCHEDAERTLTGLANIIDALTPEPTHHGVGW